MLIRNSLLYLIAKIVPAVIGLAGIAIYTRLLAADSYGVYALVIAATLLIDVIAFQWVRLGLARFFPQYRNNTKSIMNVIFKIYLQIITIVVLLAAFGYFILPYELRSLLVLGSVIIIFQAGFFLVTTLVTNEKKPVYYGLLGATRSILGLGLGVIFIKSGFGHHGLLAAIALSYALPTIVYALGSRIFVLKNVNIERGLAKDLFAYGSPLAATFALAYIVSTSDRFLLALLMNTGSAGVYSATYDLVIPPLILMMVVVNLAAYPLTFEALDIGGVEGAHNQLKKNLSLLLAIGLPAVVGIGLTAPLLVEIFLGEEFRQEALGIVPWLAAGGFFYGMRVYYLDFAFQLSRRTMKQIGVVAVAALVNLALNLFWIPIYGVRGAAYSTFVAYGIAGGVSWWFGRTAFKLPLPNTETVKVVVAVASMAGSIAIAMIHAPQDFLGLIYLIGVGCVSYALMLLAFNFMGFQNKIKYFFRSRADKEM